MHYGEPPASHQGGFTCATSACMISSFCFTETSLRGGYIPLQLLLALLISHVPAGVLHVSAAQAGACMERWGDIDAQSAPALPSLDDVLAEAAGDSSSSSSGTPTGTAAARTHAGESTSAQQQQWFRMSRADSTDRVVNEAFCLATPHDNPTESGSPVRQLQQAGRAVSVRSSTNRTRSASEAEALGPTPNRLQPRSDRSDPDSSSLGSEIEEVLQLESAAATCQCTCSRTAMYAREVLQASAAVRRQRRRALMRMLREGRTLTATGLSALASIGSSISSIASWDDEGGAVPIVNSSRSEAAEPGPQPSGSRSNRHGVGAGTGASSSDSADSA